MRRLGDHSMGPNSGSRGVITPTWKIHFCVHWMRVICPPKCGERKESGTVHGQRFKISFRHVAFPRGVKFESKVVNLDIISSCSLVDRKYICRH